MNSNLRSVFLAWLLLQVPFIERATNAQDLKSGNTAAIQTLPGFKAEKIFSVPEQMGPWTTLAVGPKGSLLAAGSQQAGIYRVTPPPMNEAGGTTQVEPLKGVAQKLGWSHGLLSAFDSLYVTVAEKNNVLPTGIYRLTDTDNNDHFNEAELLIELAVSGANGVHNLVVGTEERSLYLIAGNGVALPEGMHKRRPLETEGLNRLMPPGLESSGDMVGGWVMRFNSNGGDQELITRGLNNAHDLAFNQAGDLFTFDADMETALGAPWYRPARVYHVISGAEFGWRGGPGNWPEYYEDSVAPVVNIGPGSPSAVEFGYRAKFPEDYQRALFVCNRAFGTIHAVHLKADGAGYIAEVEEFAGGKGLLIADMTIAADGAMYFVVSGLGVESAIYRLWYTGNEKATQMVDHPEQPPYVQELRSLRKNLESLHGQANPEAVATAWPHLGHSDRRIRFAARVAIESQPVDHWRQRVLMERNSNAALTALLALARQGTPEDQKIVVDRLAGLPWGGFTEAQKLRRLRVYEVALARGGEVFGSRRPVVKRRLRPLFPDPNSHVNRELARLLCFRGDDSVIEPALKLMEADNGDRPLLGSGYYLRNAKRGKVIRGMLESAPLPDRMHYAQSFLYLKEGWSLDQHRRYFQSIANASAFSNGGHQYREHWDRMREAALNQIPEGQKQKFEEIKPRRPIFVDQGLPAPEGPGKHWTLDEAMKVIQHGLEKADLENGRKMYSAAGCILCHRLNAEGSEIGPDLTSIGQQLTTREILNATINPSKTVADPYQMTTLHLTDGDAISGRIVGSDVNFTRIAPNLMRPMESVAADTLTIRQVRREPVSTMPSELLNPLNATELRDLIGYLASFNDKE